VGPVAQASAVAWTGWADEVVGKLRSEPRTTSQSAALMDDLGRYLERWISRIRVIDRAFRWHAEIDADELEYLVHALFELDGRLLAEVERGERSGPPDEGRVFYLVLVRDLLDALERESPGRAAFVDQLRSTWPSAAEAS